MESSTVVVIALTFVLVIAVVAALYVFVIAPSFFDGAGGGWRRDRDDEPEIRDVVRGVNHALQSGYEYDIQQDEKLKEADTGHKHQEAAISQNSQKIKELEQQLKGGGGRPPGGGAGSVAASALASGIGAAAGAYMANGGWKSWGGGGGPSPSPTPSPSPVPSPSPMPAPVPSPSPVPVPVPSPSQPPAQGPSAPPVEDPVSQGGGGGPAAVADAFANDAFAEAFAAY